MSSLTPSVTDAKLFRIDQSHSSINIHPRSLNTTVYATSPPHLQNSILRPSLSVSSCFVASVHNQKTSSDTQAKKKKAPFPQPCCQILLSTQLLPRARCFSFHRAEEKAFEGIHAPITWSGEEAAVCNTPD